jgi:hypothetical protein
MRATDPKQMRIVHMVDKGTIPPIFTPPDPNGDPSKDYYIKSLSANSTKEEIDRFRWKPIITTRNDKRLAYNFGQAISFAAEKGVPLVVWKKPINQVNITEYVLRGHEDPASRFYSHFVMDAPAMLLSNVVPHLSEQETVEAFYWHSALADNIKTITVKAALISIRSYTPKESDA